MLDYGIFLNAPVSEHLSGNDVWKGTDSWLPSRNEDKDIWRQDGWGVEWRTDTFNV